MASGSLSTARLRSSESVNALGQRCRWYLRLAWERAGWPEFLVVAMLGFGLGLMVWVNKPLRHEVRALQAQALRAAVVNLNAVAAASAAPASLPQSSGSLASSLVEGLLAFLPAPDAREQQLRTLHSLAADSGVELTRVDYGHAGMEHLSARRMSMQLTVSAEYASYRKFLHNLLVAMPNLAVDRVTMEKAPNQAPGQANRLIVRLETSLFYRAEEMSARTRKEGQP